MPKLTLTRCLQAIPLLALAVVFGWAAFERFRLPMTPAADPDIQAYLTPGLSKLLGQPFSHIFGQCFLYPYFLYTVLRIGSDFRYITVVQNLLGLGTGGLLFGCWMQFRRLVPRPWLPRSVFALLGALLAGAYLLSTTPIMYERTLRPEAIFPFFVVLSISCNLQFIRDRFLDGQPRRVLLSGGGALFFSVAASLLKPSFSAALLPANLPLIISLFRAGQSIRGKAVLVLVPGLATFLLLILPEWKLRETDPMGELFLAQSLLSIHANLINDQMAEDLARHAATPFPPEVVAAAHDALSTALRESCTDGSNFWPVLGFNPDRLLHGSPDKPPFVDWLGLELGGEQRKIDFCRYYYRRVWQQHPARMAAKIARQLGAFYRFQRCLAYTMYSSFDVRDAYRQSAESLAVPREMLFYAPGAPLMARTEALANRPQRVGPIPLMKRANFVLSRSYLILCLWAVVMGAGVWMFRPWRRVFGAAAPVLLLLYSYNFGTVLTLAIGHSLDVYRYSMYQLAYTLLPEFGSAWLAFEVLAVAVLGPVGPGRAKERTPRKSMQTTDETRGQPFSGQAKAPPTVAVMLLNGGNTGEEYRAAFPAAVAVPLPAGNGAGAGADALEGIDGEVLLVIDPDAGHSIEAVRSLTAAYAVAPADVIVGCGEASRTHTTKLVRRLLRLAFGWSPEIPFSGVWLCSRSFYRNAPLFLRQDADARTLELETMAQALDKGFSIRSTPLSPDPVVTTLPHGEGEARSDEANARFVWNVLAWSVRCRPLRLLGALGMALLLVGVSLGYSPLKRAHLKKSQANPTRVLASAISLMAGLLSIQLGVLLHQMALHRREAYRLRLRQSARMG